MKHKRKIHELKEAYPEFYEHCNDMGCFDGWHEMLFALSEELKTLMDGVRKVYPTATLRCTQVKEKFGTLRWYYVANDVEEFFEAISRTVEHYEYISGRTCEFCGEPGIPRRLDWIKTLCDEHSEIASQKGYKGHVTYMYGEDGKGGFSSNPECSCG